MIPRIWKIDYVIEKKLFLRHSILLIEINPTRDPDKTFISSIYWRYFSKLGFSIDWFLVETFYWPHRLDSKLQPNKAVDWPLAISESLIRRIFQEYGLILLIVEDYAIVLDGAKSVWNGSFQNLSDNDCVKIELRKENSVVHECLLMFQIPYETPYQE